MIARRKFGSWRQGKSLVAKLPAFLVLLLVGVGSGAAVAAADGAGTANPASGAFSLHVAAAPTRFSKLTIQDVAQRAKTGSGKPRASHTSRPSPARPVALPPILSPGRSTHNRASMQEPSSLSVPCDRLDDSKIYWLMELAAKAREEHPEAADAASKVDQRLRAALGKNLCASQAQVELGSLCADPSVVRFMKHMVRELPFFVRPLVGDPCKADLVEAANRWLPRQ